MVKIPEESLRARPEAKRGGAPMASKVCAITAEKQGTVQNGAQKVREVDPVGK